MAVDITDMLVRPRGLRFICRSVWTGRAAAIGGPPDVEWITFTDACALEDWLRFVGDDPRGEDRSCVGVELCAEASDAR